MTDLAQDAASPEPGPPTTNLPLEPRDVERTGSQTWTGRISWCAFGLCALSASAAASPGVQGGLGGALGLVMLRIAFTDSRRFVIPDALSGAAFALGVVHAIVASPEAGLDGALAALMRGAFAAGLLLIVRIGYRLVRRREGIGLGDVKLAGAAGAWLSLPMLAVAIDIAAVAALGAYFWRQRKRARTLRATARLPFGAFFAPAIWAGWIFDTTLGSLN
jgi:leader peptidase (prepilin peptidase) / N-methyltransferase